ncbi:MAG: efflux transporter periplasmic adaptor subunit, partial [Pedobacter sp.]
MDTAITPTVLNPKRKKRIMVITIIAVILVAGVFALRAVFAAKLTRSAITTAVVERGNIENTINASGEILPEFEEIITSPINAAIQQVLVDAGTTVKTGQPVLTLDKAVAQMEYEKQRFNLASSQNDMQKLKLELDKSFYDIKSNNSIKQLRISSLEADVENAKRLFKAGGGTREDVEKAELNLKVAGLEKQQLENEIKSKQQTMQVQIREAGIAASIQQGALRELERKLQLANIVAKRDGVVTWINKNIGATIQE